MENSSRNQGSGTVSMNTTSRGVEQSMLDGQTTEIQEQMGDVNMDHRRNIPMQHINADTRQSQFFRTQDKMTRHLKTQAKMKLALGVFSQMMAFSQIW